MGPVHSSGDRIYHRHTPEMCQPRLPPHHHRTVFGYVRHPFCSWAPAGANFSSCTSEAAHENDVTLGFKPPEVTVGMHDRLNN